MVTGKNMVYNRCLFRGLDFVPSITRTTLSFQRLGEPCPQGLLLDDFQNGGSPGEGPGDEVGGWA